jgi:hypothetical protein
MFLIYFKDTAFDEEVTEIEKHLLKYYIKQLEFSQVTKFCLDVHKGVMF